MIKIYNYKKIKALLSSVKGLEIQESLRVYAPSTLDLNVVLIHSNTGRHLSSPCINVNYESNQKQFFDGIIYETELKSILRFLAQIKDIQIEKPENDLTKSSELFKNLVQDLKTSMY